MAVQAQYPSNLLFHDRGEPERKEMDLPKPPQLAGISPAAYFASDGASGNWRKRTREAMAPPLAKEEYINLFTLQPQQPASFFATAQLHNRVASSPSPAPATLVSTGLRLALDEQQQQQSKKINSSLCYSSSPSPFVSFSDELAGQMKQHDEELDRFICDQGEQLRRAMVDRVRHHNRALLVAADKSAARRLREKASERACLTCHLRLATVVLLPCRHLSLCGGCFAAGDMDVALACPVCHCVRTGNVEAILC